VNARCGILLICLSLLACDRPVDRASVSAMPVEKLPAGQPAELQFPLVPLKPGEVIHSASAQVHCDTSLEWLDLPDGWLAARHRWSESWSNGSANTVVFDEQRLPRTGFRPLDVDGVLPRLRIGHTEGDCAEWELSVKVGSPEMKEHDPKLGEFYLNQDSPTAWYNAPEPQPE
jgi:hypothetical protein